MTTHKVIPISTAPAKPATPGIGNEVTARLLDGHTEGFFSTGSKHTEQEAKYTIRSSEPIG